MQKYLKKYEAVKQDIQMVPMIQKIPQTNLYHNTHKSNTTACLLCIETLQSKGQLVLLTNIIWNKANKDSSCSSNSHVNY